MDFLIKSASMGLGKIKKAVKVKQGAMAVDKIH